MPLSSDDRAAFGRIGALESWSRTSDPGARTAPAREAFMGRFEREVDPDGVLDAEERARRAAFARRAYFARLSVKAASARRRAGAGPRTDVVELPSSA